jgi:DNA topoisomerase-1
MIRKKQQTNKEKIAQDYFPLDEIKQTTEKIQKDIDKELRTIEVPTKKITMREKSSVEKRYNEKLVERIEIKQVKQKSPEKIKLNKRGYELIITEKPQAALKIASALGDAIQKTLNNVSYYELERDSRQIVVACAVGHLFTLKQKVKGSNVPIFEIGWTPNYLARKNDFTKRYYDVLLRLAKNAGSITVATDFDVEGEVIGWNVVRFICMQKDANRMKFSTLTRDELNEAYDKKSSHIEWGQAIAGETRHYLDWFYGINLSRALMNAIKTTGKFRIMSIGRVQGPALNLIVKKEKEIQKFKPKPFWQIFIKIKNEKKILELKHPKEIFDKKDLDKFRGLKGRVGVAQTTKTEQILPPNSPFNLTILQTECYKLFGLKPARTLQIAQGLYLSGLISYPRTSSQKLPESINYKSIINKLAKKFKAEKLIKRKNPIEGKKDDPAHPSIYPTGNLVFLSGNEEKVYSLIVKRFLCLFCEDAIIDKKRVLVDVDNLSFTANGSQISKKAWLEIYPYKPSEVEVPDIDGEVKIINSNIEEKETSPPKRYSPASIIYELEKRNLGTKATRSSIVETLFDRGYVEGTSIKATAMGIALIDSLNKYSPIIIDEELTRSFEEKMQLIKKLNKGFLEKEKSIVDDAKKTITKISEDFKEHENKIGKELLKANIKHREFLKKENELIICPKCKKGKLAVTYSRKTKRFFVACNAYPECKTTYSLPPNGVIKKISKICGKCGFPLLMILRKYKRPWIFCFNKDCESNKEKLEEYNKSKYQKK